MRLKIIFIFVVFISMFGSISSFSQTRKKNHSQKTSKAYKTHRVYKRQRVKAVERSSDEYYNGHKIYTGPRGGRYYINSNGKKTYLSSK